MRASCTNSFSAQIFRTALNMATQLPVCPLPVLVVLRRFATDATARLSYKQIIFAAPTPNRLCKVGEGLQLHPAVDRWSRLGRRSVGPQPSMGRHGYPYSLIR